MYTIKYFVKYVNAETFKLIRSQKRFKYKKRSQPKSIKGDSVATFWGTL